MISCLQSEDSITKTVLNAFAVTYVASACNTWEKASFGMGKLFATAYVSSSASAFSALGIYCRVNP